VEEQHDCDVAKDVDDLNMAEEKDLSKMLVILVV